MKPQMWLDSNLPAGELIEHRFMLGAGAGDQRVLPKIHGCHPETWAVMPEGFRANYDVKTEEEMQEILNRAVQCHRDGVDGFMGGTLRAWPPSDHPPKPGRRARVQKFT